MHIGVRASAIAKPKSGEAEDKKKSHLAYSSLLTDLGYNRRNQEANG